jgi:hypothetical protein
MPTFEKAHIPVRKRRSLWMPGFILIIIGLALFGAGWVNGSRGGSVYVDEDGFHMSVNEAGETNGIHINEFNLPPFSELDVQAGFADIHFEEADSYGLEIRLPSGHQPKWEIDNGKLIIEADSSESFSFQLFNMEFTESGIWVYYPEGHNLEAVKLETGSGGIEARLRGNETVEAKSGSGSVILNNEGCENRVKVETGSGEVELYGGEWIDAEVETGSGGITIDGLLNGALYGTTVLETGSGEVEISGLDDQDDGFYSYDISTGSGSIRIDGNRYERNYKSDGGSGNEIKVRTGSGSITIE